MSNYRIGLDLDGVVANWAEAAARYFNTYHGYTFPLADPPSWDWFEEQVTKEQWEGLWKEAVPIGFFATVQPCIGALEFVEALSKLGDVVVITNRPKTALADTWDWLVEWGFAYHLTGFNLMRSGKDKALVRCNVLIDDRGENVVDWVSNVIYPTKGILFDRAYNQAMVFPPWMLDAHMLGYAPLVVRAKTYSDVLKQVEEWSEERRS